MAFAASHVLLTARCGADVAVASLVVLERAFDAAAVCVVPPVVCKRLVAIIPAVLADEGLAAIPTEQADRIRLSLFKVAQLASASGHLPSEVWNVSGIRIAVSHDGEVGELLRSFSKSGLVSTTACDMSSKPRSKGLSPARRPRRRRRITKNPPPTDTEEQSSGVQEALSQSVASLGDGREPVAPVATLIKELGKLGSIYSCVEEPKALQVLRRVAALSADALRYAETPKNAKLPCDALESWLTFAHSISQIIIDVTSSIKLESTRDLWEGLLLLGSESLRLATSLSALDHNGTFDKALRNSTLLATARHDCSVLIGSVVTVLDCASQALLSNQGNIPTGLLSDLIWRLGERARRESSTVDEELVSGVCERIRSCALQASSVCKLHEKQSLLKSSFHAIAAMHCRVAPDRVASDLSTLRSLVPEYSTKSPGYAAAALYAISDLICRHVDCDADHLQTKATGKSEHESLSVFDESEWMVTFPVVSSVVRGTGADELILAAAHCLGILVVHAPLHKIGEAISVLVQTIWHPTSSLARERAIAFVSALLLQHLERQDRGIELHQGSIFSSYASSLRRQDDSWDGIEKVLSLTGEPSDVFRLLGIELQNRTQSWSTALQSHNVKDIEKLDIGPLGLILGLRSDASPMARIKGLAADYLLAAAISELQHWQASLNSQSEKAAQVPTLPLKAWKRLLNIESNGNGARYSSWARANYDAGTTTGANLVESRQAVVYGRRPIALQLSRFLSSSLSEWLPFTVCRMLQNDSFTEALSVVLLCPNVEALWKKVPRYAVGPFLRQKDAVGLESLALRVNQSKKDLVDQVCADALARAAMTDLDGFDLSPTGANALILESLGTPLATIIRKRAGKIVQRIIMDIGGERDPQARRALFSVAQILQISRQGSSTEPSVVGALVSTHFMLVMDAVNRGLFSSRASEKDRMHYLRMLDGVIGLAHERLHVYVPKILATLKMAAELERESLWFHHQTMKAWTNFLLHLGPKRMLPHLGSILAILLPMVSSAEDNLAATLQRLIAEGKRHSFADWAEIVLLLRMAKHPILKETAKQIAAEVTSESVHPLETDVSIQTDAPVTHNLLKTCESVGKIITQHENGVIEVMAADYLRSLLKKNRKLLDGILRFDRVQGYKKNREIQVIARLLGGLVENLNKTKNEVCQNIIMHCIGEIGAVDPAIVMQFSRAQSKKSATSLRGSHTYSCTVHSLVAFLLDEFLVPSLVRGEKASGSRSLLNRVGLVIQELLRVCGCRANTAARASKAIQPRRSQSPPVDWKRLLVGDTEEENGIFFWECLEGTTRTVAQPYLAEPFDVQHYKGVFGGNSAGDITLACQPVWSKVKAASLAGVVATAQEWRRQIVVQLVDYIGNQSRFGKTLKASRPVLRYDDNVAAYMFPFAITAALDIQRGKRCVEVQEFLVSEIVQVLNECPSPQPVFDLLDILRTWREERCKLRGRTFPSRFNTAEMSSAKRRALLEVKTAKERVSDPLSPLVDLDGNEADQLSLLVQARAAYGARSYYRAVMLAEYYIRNLREKHGYGEWPAFIESLRQGQYQVIEASSAELEALSILQKSFAELEDPESMTGLATLRGKTSLGESVIDAEAAGRLDEALLTYERALASSPRQWELHDGFLRCLMTLGHWETMLSHAEGLVSSANLDEKRLRQSAQALGIDAAWRLGRWDKVADFGKFSADTDRQNSSSGGTAWTLDFNVSFGRMLTSLRNRKTEQLRRAACEARSHLRVPIVRLAREGYSRAYPMLTLLHSLSDIEDTIYACEAMTESSEDTNSMREISYTPLISLAGRFAATAPSLKIREPLLSAKRVCYELLHKKSEAAAVDLQLAQLAHEEDNLRAASVYAFNASSKVSIDEVRFEAVLQMARLCHDQGDASGALLMVEKEIHSLQMTTQASEKVCGKSAPSPIPGRLCTAYVLAGRWIEEARSEPSEVILSFFEHAAVLGPSREEPFYALGRHYDALLQAGSNTGSNVSLPVTKSAARSSRRALEGGSDPLSGSEYVPLIIKSFAQALCNGNERIYEALPRMMTVWFDYHSAANCPDARLSGGPVEADVKREMKKALESIPVYMWMTAIPQLMSRLLHPRKTVRDELTQLLARIFCAFPDECTWLILPSSQLKTIDRKKAASAVLNQAVQMRKMGRALAADEDRQEQVRNLKSKIHGAISVVRSFIDICFTLLPKDRRGRSENCAREFTPLRERLTSSKIANPIIPAVRTLTVQLSSTPGIPHTPFASEPVRIADIEDKALVMSSLMRPRRISLLGSDGRQYRFLAKKETAGDMRKDSRLVEFMTVVNRLLSKDSKSRQKDLELKTYAVLPLTEETGMIEWVNDLDPLRKLVREQHLAIPNLPEVPAIQTKYQNTTDPKTFFRWVLNKFPPVLDKFFLYSFGGGTNPQSWLDARNTWTKSVAVWSMAGYVVGLGDRHGENVLIETTTGRCVHVDFAMLFDKGMALKVPEVVPFRLTPNMVSAMGVAGYEGTFRVVSEMVMGILRKNSDALLGVLETFLHDPLADWGRSDTKGANGTVIASKEAWQTRAAVKAKLTGMVDSSGMPLSIQGQVQRLIHEATSEDNLSKMYLWWSGWV